MQYRTIVADPPWPYGRKWGGFKGVSGLDWTGRTLDTGDRPLPYAEMSIATITALPVASLAAPDARCFLWTTNRFLPDAFAVLAAWGFRYGQTLVWAKTPRGRGPGNLFAQNAEYILMGTRGSVPRISQRQESVWFNWPRTAVHSRKPEAFQDLVEQVSPGPYLELFGRRTRLGWHTLGNEIDGRDIRSVLALLA
jgi:N6-adenosine-specific RNA methylase IME4